MGIREDALALADELEAFEDGDCEECSLYGQPECKGRLSCMEVMARYAARKIREAVERDGECATTVSAYDLLPEEDREALAWVREHGGLGAVEKRLMPEGMEWLLDVWPRWSNGEYCKFGDWWKAGEYGEREPQQLSRLAFFTPEQLREWGQDEGENFGYEWNFMRPSDATYRPDKAEPPAPKALAADGKPLEVGQTVWHIDTGIEYWVKSGQTITSDAVVIIRKTDCDCESEIVKASQLTHHRPVLDADGNRIEPAMDVWWICEGDELGIHAEKLHVESIGEDGFVECSPFNGGTWVELDSTELYVHKPVPDADGEPIREGDTVYVLGFVEPLTVKGFTDDGRVLMSFHGENSLGYKPSKLTHEQPDTWERLEEDARQLDIYLNDTTDDYPRMSCCRDLVRRCRALVEKENRNE